MVKARSGANGLAQVGIVLGLVVLVIVFLIPCLVCLAICYFSFRHEDTKNQ